MIRVAMAQRFFRIGDKARRMRRSMRGCFAFKQLFLQRSRPIRWLRIAALTGSGN